MFYSVLLSLPFVPILSGEFDRGRQRIYPDSEKILSDVLGIAQRPLFHDLRNL